MVLWNSRRRGKPREPSRVSAYFSTPKYNVGNEHNDLSTLHGYSAHETGNIDARKYSTERTYTGDRGGRVNYSSNDELHIGDAFSGSRTYPELVPGRNETRSEDHNEQPSKTNPTVGSDGLWSWIPHVTQSADDATVAHRVREVFSIAEQFVNNFYTNQTYSGEILDATLDAVNCSQLLSTTELQERLKGSSYQTVLIKHVLVALLLGLLSFDSIAEQGSLLPKEFQTYIMLAEARTRDKSSADDIPQIQPALSSYRVLTAYIHSNVDNDPEYIEDKRELTDELIEKFGMAFNHWSLDETKLENRTTAFRQLLEKAAGLGCLLFSQPSVFYFDWQMAPRDQAANLLPVSPRLLRVFDNEAQLKQVADHLVPIKCARMFSDSSEQEKKVE